ncbi:galactokinase [Mucilaginibacter ginkgonis]|uniref:Galactokinase n=1 Tax=Mucilaginibacter ginkgonis TaxID=2682091 RepID=A0A6I4HW30_9SPHI|nr:galactokinase [Mucilaginibacter ginkgonis]QQL51042.1 galactokinase [Mucilaginibacter ginkgonis]
MELYQLQEQFKKIYGRETEHVYFSPGRVNLIGEHIDYNGGLVMPCAVTFGTYLLLNVNDDNLLSFNSLNFEEKAEVKIHSSYTKDQDHWYNYPIGVVNELMKNGCRVQGVDMLFYGNLPIGAGLSSSASIEIVTAYALNEIFNCGLTKLDLVKLCKIVENNFIGVSSGIMDQFAVAFGETNKALKLDCATLDYEAVDCDLGDYVLAIINTNKPRRLAESKYNERVAECHTALAALQAELDLINLCDIDGDSLKTCEHLITDDIIKKRAQHIVQENDRVKQAAQELSVGNLKAFGKLMYASHYSLQHLYEVSGVELDTIVDYCKTDGSVIGARMTGAGFGGCAIALVQKDAFESFRENITKYYSEKIGYAPSVYNSVIGDGVRRLA